MKRIGAWILTAVFCLALAGCAEPTDQTEDETSPTEQIIMDRYDRKTYLEPCWSGNSVVNETVLFVGTEGAPLLYEPTEILSVRSYGLDEEYEEGVDYEYRDGKLYRLNDGSIPYFSEIEYYPVRPEAGATFPVDQNVNPDHAYIKFGELDTFCSRQIAVTYRHASEWEGYVPTAQKEAFSSFFEKLSKKESVNLVFYGDSITTGANSSQIIGCAPFSDGWPQMVTKELESRCGVNINETNTAVGGTSTSWGLQNVEENVIRYNPDLVILAFGMNDVNLPADQYRAQIRSIVETVRESCPSAAFLLVSPMLPNREVSGFYGTQPQFEAELCGLAEELEACGVAEVTTMHRALLERKRYFDMTGNNVNHPNDFLARLYAQTILASLGESGGN